MPSKFSFAASPLSSFANASTSFSGKSGGFCAHGPEIKMREPAITNQRTRSTENLHKRPDSTLHCKSAAPICSRNTLHALAAQPHGYVSGLQLFNSSPPPGIQLRNLLLVRYV